jgi:hypothetical protein
MTITDHDCSKAMIFIPCKETDGTEKMVELYTQHDVPHYGIPTKIISDRNPRLTAELFKELCNAFGVRRNMSTAYHPQTDGQSERTNQTLEMFLRIFCNHQQNDWAKLLPVAQYALNARRSTTTKKAPFEALIGYIPSVHQHAAITRFQNIEDRLSAIKVIRREAQSHMKHTQDLLIMTNAFKPYTLGQRVWLEATNLRTTHPTAKLRPKRYGPFTITRIISHVAYQLDLPLQWKIHNVFHAAYLSPYKETEEHGPNFPEPPPDLIEGEKEYEVERIINMRHFGRNKKLQYKVQWKGYSEVHDSWEPVDNIHTPELLEQYHRETRTAIRAIRINTTPMLDETAESASPLLPHSQPPQKPSPSSLMSASVIAVDHMLPHHHLHYLEEHDLELLGIEDMGCPPDPKKVNKYIVKELGLDIESPMFKWDVDSLIEDFIQQLPDDHPYFRTNESPKPLPVPFRLPSIAQLELGEELAEDIPRLPSPPFAEFPTVSALASEESDTSSVPPSWSPVSDDPPVCSMEHPGSPWEKYNFRTHCYERTFSLSFSHFWHVFSDDSLVITRSCTINYITLTDDPVAY